MTRFEYSLACVIKEISENKYPTLYFANKVKTKENYVYTKTEYRINANNFSEKELFDYVMGLMSLEQENLNSIIDKDGFIWLHEEGRLIRVDDIKEVWFECTAIQRIYAADESIVLNENRTIG